MSEEISALNADRVNSIFVDCLFRDDEDTTDYIIAEGVTMTVGFHPGRIEGYRQDIHDMLAELPDEFKANSGGGYSFLHACMDKYGNQWTGEHRIVEQLVQLGIAIGEVDYCLPREYWSYFTGGMPYIKVTSE